MDDLPSIGLALGRDLADLTVAFLLFWGAIAWLRRTRALRAFLGLGVLALVYLVAHQFGLQLTARIFQGFSAVVLVLVVVVFQADLRRLLDRLGSWGFEYGLARGAPRGVSFGVVDTLVRAVTRLAQTHTGALIVLPGLEPLDAHLDGGILLDARLSEPLLLSLFDHNSPGHDGALLVEGERAARYALRLPLSTNQEQLHDVGTRHTAALGLAERCDALVVVVSEERGVVSVARGGVLTLLGGVQELAGILKGFRDEVAPVPIHQRFRLHDVFAGQWRSVLAAAVLTGVSWFLVGPGANPVEVQRTAQLVFENLPAGMELEEVSPVEVRVTLSGPRRRLYWAPPRVPPRIKVDAVLAALGRRTFQLDPDQVEAPRGTEVVGVEPSSVRISLRAPEGSTPGQAEAGGPEPE